MAERQFLWTHSIFELLYQNEFHSAIVCISEQENVSLQAVLKIFFFTTVVCSQRYFYNLHFNFFFIDELSPLPQGSQFKKMFVHKK